MNNTGENINFFFYYLQKQRQMSQSVKTDKVDEKIVVICKVFLSPSWVMVLKKRFKKRFFFFFLNFVLMSA